MNDKLLIFDLDGTLADTLHTIRDAVNMCMEHYGYPTHDYESIRERVGNGVRDLIGRSLPLGKDDPRFDEILEHFNSCYLITHDQIDGCYDGLYSVIEQLADKGFRLAVLSNKPDRLVKGIVKKLFPEGMFAISMGQTEQPRKPDPTVPLMMAERLGVAAEDTWFIGDSEVDVATAKNAGMHSVAVSWGFRSRESLVDCAPDAIADSPEELLALFVK